VRAHDGKHEKLQLMMITISGCDASFTTKRELLENKSGAPIKTALKIPSQQSAADGNCVFGCVDDVS
jgi:hypothetical protein